MARHRVTIFYRRSEKPESQVEYLGGLNSDGSDWKIKLERAIYGIESGKWELYIVKDNIEIDLKVIIKNNIKYLMCDMSKVDFINIMAINL
ncbi:hypothetical protein OA84_06070 [Kaistella solincola]|uniref:Uncharacterized protein n=1 Tax=Kaistella solincola TaxID=510955 RepID=A0ABR4ZP44_9FLAO|nr:hypothetical protein [Kaistella solincola]KIA83115.1 hypothetical protein OA84_06070 [Kaistella solincola]